MNAITYEAVRIVHAGLAEVLAWLGEDPIESWHPRHAARTTIIATNLLGEHDPFEQEPPQVGDLLLYPSHGKMLRWEGREWVPVAPVAEVDRA